MYRLKCFGFFFVIIYFTSFCIAGISSCQNDKRNKSHASVSLESIEKGKSLAAVYCSSCHQLPDPSMLDAGTWEKGVLPNMGPLLGIFTNDFEMYPSGKNDPNLDSGFYPSRPVISDIEWQNIIDYYTATSPDSMPLQQRNVPIKMGLPVFSVQKPFIHYAEATTSFIKLNMDSLRNLIISDVLKQQTFFLDKNFRIIDSVHTRGAFVNMEFEGNNLLTCDIGVLNPTNGKFGKAGYMRINEQNKIEEDSVSLFKNLQRPVQVSATDLNNDGKTDYLICEFGFLTGGLSWMENLGNNQYKRRDLRSLPGAIKAYFQDYNHDGKLDIWVLFAQGEEGVFLFTNKGNGTFGQEEVLQFPSVYGSSYFELADFNNDGFPDIVYTCGDNADFSPVLKPYHGVYIFLNDQTNHFSQKFFFPIHGCYKAMARDFDSDGDLDLATISYFADYLKQPEEGFVYLKNLGGWNFEAWSLEGAIKGRWLTMDAGDLDGDGKIDLVLGNFSMGPALMRSATDWKKEPPFILLQNTGKK